MARGTDRRRKIAAKPRFASAHLEVLGPMDGAAILVAPPPDEVAARQLIGAELRARRARESRSDECRGSRHDSGTLHTLLRRGTIPCTPCRQGYRRTAIARQRIGRFTRL